MENNYITRIQERSLSTWLMRPRRKPLVIRGARQVGKSTLIRTFAKNSNRNLVEINLEDHRSSLRPAMETGHFEEALAALVRVAGLDFRKDPASHFLFLTRSKLSPPAFSSCAIFMNNFPT